MTVALADGILGMEAKHQWTPLGGSAFAINDLAASPRTIVDRISGLHSLGDADDIRAPRGGQLGEVVYPGQTRGKTVVYEGRVQCASLQSLRATCRALRGAFRDRSNEGVMAAIPHATYGTGYFYYYARVIALDIDDDWVVSRNHPRSVFQRKFTLGLRQSDPRYFWYTAYALGDIADGATTAVTNLGSTSADPIFSVAVASADSTVTLENLTTSRTLQFTGLPVGQLAVNFRARTATSTGALIDVIGNLDIPNSDWWDEGVAGLVPGAQNVRCTQSPGSGLWLLTFAHASE